MLSIMDLVSSAYGGQSICHSMIWAKSLRHKKGIWLNSNTPEWNFDLHASAECITSDTCMSIKYCMINACIKLHWVEIGLFLFLEFCNLSKSQNLKDNRFSGNPEFQNDILHQSKKIYNQEFLLSSSIGLDTHPKKTKKLIRFWIYQII